MCRVLRPCLGGCVLSLPDFIFEFSRALDRFTALSGKRAQGGFPHGQLSPLRPRLVGRSGCAMAWPLPLASFVRQAAQDDVWALELPTQAVLREVKQQQCALPVAQHRSLRPVYRP
eukprot:3712439-Amphidinium_carterae.1